MRYKQQEDLFNSTARILPEVVFSVQTNFVPTHFPECSLINPKVIKVKNKGVFFLCNYHLYDLFLISRMTSGR